MTRGRDTSAGLGTRVRDRLDAAGIGPATPLVVACSGGMDSTVLLHLLRFATGQEATSLTVAHFDHAMRPGSPNDAAWLRGLVRAWGLPFRSGRPSSPPRGETAARAARWAFLEAVVAEVGAVGVVTAHHAGDQAETVLHNLLRGTGLRGLAGMAPHREERIRPLLGETRATLAEWARVAGIGWREDPTNALPGTVRNRLRHEALPLLEAIRPGAADGIVRTAGVVAADERALAQAEDLLLPTLVTDRAAGRWTVDLAALLRLPLDLRARLLRRLAREVGGGLDGAGTRAAMEFTTGGPGAGECRLPGDLVFRRSLGTLEVEGPGGPARIHDHDLEVGSDVPAGEGEVVVGGERWRVVWGPEPLDLPWSTRLSLSPRDYPLRVRGWRAGDRILQGGRAVAVGRAMGEAGIPRHERRRRPVVESGRARLLWVPGSVRSSEADGEAGTPLFIGIRHVDIL